jgi:hypothetical protein
MDLKPTSSAGIRGVLAIALLFAVLSGLAPHATYAAASPIPAQFIGKLYTEALGRAPDYAGWSVYTTKFATEGCTTANLREVATVFYTSGDYDSRGYDNESKLSTLYRGALNREIDVAGRDLYLQQLNTGTPWTQVLNSILSSSEFGALTPTYCQPGPYGFGRGVGNAGVIPAATTGTGNKPATAAALNQELQTMANNGGGVYVLAQKWVIKAETQISVPANVTLTTAGNLFPTQYAKMARIVRNFRGNDLVFVNAGGSVKGLWIDGQRTFLGYIDATRADKETNISVLGGTASIEQNRVSDTAGWSHIFVGRHVSCSATSPIVIKNNLVTDYAGVHGVGVSDGITVACGETRVEDNTVVDATDVGIILFAAGSTGQNSKVQRNTIIQVGNSANSALAIETVPCVSSSDPKVKVNCPAGTPSVSFAGTVMGGNTLWTDTTAPAYKTSQTLRSSPHFDIAIVVGTRPFWGEASPKAIGGRWENNGSGGFSLNTNDAIAVSGATSAFVNGNAFSITSHGPFNKCPRLGIAVGNADETSGSTIQSYQLDTSGIIRTACINAEH